MKIRRRQTEEMGERLKDGGRDLGGGRRRGGGGGQKVKG